MIPTINFYVLNSQSTHARYIFACRLAEKAYRLGYKSYIWLDTMPQAEQIDKLLWVFRPNSFVPHDVYRNETINSANAVLIGAHPAPEVWQHTLINLSSQHPINTGSFTQIFELLDNDEAHKQAARLRYRQYKVEGITPNTYKI